MIAYGHAIAYSEDGISHSSGASLSFERDSSERIERIVDELGRTIEYRYGNDGMLEQVIQKGGGSYATKVLENYAYNMGVNEVPVLKDIIAPDGTRLGTFEYDSQGRKIGLIDHEGHRVLFGYDAPEHHYTVTDRRGNPTEYTYDSDGNVTSITDAEGNTKRYSYDEDGNVLAKTNKLGYTNAFSYDEDGNVLRETDPLGNSVSFSYDADGNKLSATDPLGNITSFTYDRYGNTLSKTDALGHRMTYEYDSDGLKISETDALGYTTSYTYTPQGKMATKTDPLGNTSAYTYDADGNTLSSTDPLGHVTSSEYDRNGNVTRETNASGHSVSYSYDAQGNRIGTTDALGFTSRSEYNPDGKLLSRTNALGHLTSFAYDPNGNTLSQSTMRSTSQGVEEANTQYVYDSANRQIETIDPAGNSSRIEYNAAGLRTAVVDPLGNRTAYAYDPAGRLVSTSYPDGTSSSVSYDAEGRTLSSTDRAGRVTSYSYDELGRKVSTTYPDGTATLTQYGPTGKVLSVIDARGYTTSYTYEAECNCSSGRRATTTDALGHVTSYEYDANGNTVAISDANGHTTGFEYDSQSRKVKTIFADGSSATVEYDAADRVIEERIHDPETGQSVSVYAYDPVGNLSTKTENGVTTTYIYDENDRLLSGEGYTYTYDNNGNMLSKTGHGQQYRFSYNALDQLRRATISTLQVSSTIEYLYDHDGIRVGKIIDGVDETRYLVDKNLPYAQVIEEERRHGALSATVNYVYGHGLISQNIDGIKQYYHYDGLHNTRALSGVSGEVTDTYHYDAYGALTEQTGTTENSYLYRGEQFDRESGNYYLRARYYSPETGRFSTTDPLEGDVADQRTFHRYRYGNGDPVNNLDPTGAWSVTESLVTANIVSMLSSYGGWMLADKYQQQFAKISEWFPDAGVVGGSIDVFGARNLQLLRKLPWFRKVVAPILKWTDPTAVTSRNILWRYPMQPMFALGAEGVFSFGSREIGAAICFSPQVRGGYASKYDIPQKKPSGRSWNLYTGYIWNLWNFRDYLGGSGVINLGIGSYFFGMKFNEELTQFTAFHYGGLHWNILPVSPGGLSWGGGFGYTYRVLAARVGDVPAESLACWWTSLQGAIALVSTLKHNNLSAVATMVGTGFTGMIVKSKQVYNKQHGLEEQGRTEYGEKGTRPADWHSGFQLDLSRMYLLGL